jgi:hypothetical protein
MGEVSGRVTSGRLPNPAANLELSRLWAVTLPKWLDPWAPQLALSMGDGVWVVAWPKVTPFTPVAALGVGLLSALVSPGWHFVYTESLPFLAFIITGAILSGPIGIMLVVGFAIGNFFLARPELGPSVVFGGGGLVKTHASLLLSYLLLGFLAVRVPFMARLFAEGTLVRIPDYGRIRSAARWILFPLLCGALVFLWCQATIVLIRPVFIWSGQFAPTVEAIHPIQSQWQWLAGTAVAASLARLALEGIVGRNLGSSERLKGLQAERWVDSVGASGSGVSWRRVGLTAVAGTFLLAGFYTGWVDALVVGLTLLMLRAWNVGLVARQPVGWVNVVRRVPALVRFAAALLVGYAVSRMITEVAYASHIFSFRLLLIGVLATIVILYICFPNQRPAGAPAGGDHHEN